MPSSWLSSFENIPNSLSSHTSSFILFQSRSCFLLQNAKARWARLDQGRLLLNHRSLSGRLVSRFSCYQRQIWRFSRQLHYSQTRANVRKRQVLFVDVKLLPCCAYFLCLFALIAIHVLTFFLILFNSLSCFVMTSWQFLDQ